MADTNPLSSPSREDDQDDQYASVAAHYDRIIGSLEQRSALYRSFFADLLKQHGCRAVLDASCGTGVDSVILLEHGFNVVSIDASLPMLEFAQKIKADKTGDPRYDNWIIKQAKWETLPEDLASFLPHTQFDAVICLANSIAHVLDDDGRQTAQRRCLANLALCVRPGGLLLVDHRNYDALLDGLTPARNVYYKYSNPVEIKSTLVMEGGKPKMITSEFCVNEAADKTTFQLSSYPHRLVHFSRLLRAAVGRSEHYVLGDFLLIGDVPVPAFYLHVVQKPR